MKKISSFAALGALSLLLLSGCSTGTTPNQNIIPKDANPATPTTTIQDYDIVTTTYTGTDELAISAIVIPGIVELTPPAGTMKPKNTAVPTQSYTAALNDNAGKRFQFVACAGNPGVLSIKKGTNFMLDNRDNKTHIFGIGKNTYELKAYDFALVNVKTAGDYFITCDGGGAAKVSIQG